MKKTCIAVIGCGRIADRAHFPVFKRLNSVRVKYACDIIREKAEAKKKELEKWSKIADKQNVSLFKKLTSKNKKETVEEEPKTKLCPYCLSEIPFKATKCAHCTSKIDE